MSDGVTMEKPRYRGICIGCGQYFGGLDDWEGSSQVLCSDCQRKEDYELGLWEYPDDEDEFEVRA